MSILKVVVKLELHDEKDKRKALKAVSTLSGINSISMDMKGMKLTVIGEIDPVEIVGKLRKQWPHASIDSVGAPAKEGEKKEGGGGNKKEGAGGEKKAADVNKQITDLVEAYKAYNPHMTTHYVVHSIEEDPNSCVIC